MSDILWSSEIEEEEEEVEYLNIVRFNLFGYIDADMSSRFIQALWEQDNEDTGAVWEVVINTEGGDMEAGTAIFSELRAYSERCGGSHYIIVRVRGQAASCGSLILLAGDYRTAGKMDSIMFHEPLMTFSDASLRRVKDELEQAESWTTNLIDIIMERATKSRAFYEGEIENRDWWVTAADAFEYGLIDEVA